MNENRHLATHRRSCPTCEACCGLIVSVDPRQRKVVSVQGDPDDHRSRGYVCAKSQVFKHVHEDPQRLRRPVRRVGDQWQEISWDEALGMTAEKLNEVKSQYGKDAIAFYVGNPTGHDYASAIYLRGLMETIGTERFFSAGTVDQHPQQIGSWVLYGDDWLFPIPDVDHTDLFIILGANPAVSQGSLMGTADVPRKIRELRERGGRCVVFDPRRTETAELADQHIFIRPGTDSYMLLAFINVLANEGKIDLGHLEGVVDGVEEVLRLAADFTPENTEPVTQVPAQTLRELALRYAATPKSALYGRIGLCTQEFGTLASWLVDVISILTGKLDARGGMMFPLAAHAPPVPKPDQGAAPFGRFRSRVRGFPETCGELPASLMAEEINAPGKDRVRALLVQCGNPVLSVPNGKQLRQACQELDFMVCLDIYINETTSMADLILPSTTHLERSNYDMLFSSVSSRNYARYSPASFEPEADEKEMWEIQCELTARLNGITAQQLDDAMFDGLIDSAISQAKQAGRTLEKDAIKAAATVEGGPERLLEVMLRNGPYGDHYREGKLGLSLQGLKREGLIDLGPLQSRFPQGLNTKGKRISLVHEQISNDFPRLRKRFEELREAPANGELLLIGRRHIRDMNSWLHNLKHYSRGKNRCTLMMHQEDARQRGIDAGGMVTVSSDVGEQTVEVELNANMMRGIVSLPHGFGHVYAGTQQDNATQNPGVSCNDLLDPTRLDVASGTSIVNGLSVRVRPAA